MQGLEYPTGEAKRASGPHAWLRIGITWELGQDTDSGAPT